METIEIVITKEDFDKSSRFVDVFNCPLATTMKKVLKNNHIAVGENIIDEIHPHWKTIGRIEPSFTARDYDKFTNGEITEFRTVFTPV